MTSSLLRHLADRYAFDSTPRFVDLGAYHVPFESMADNTSVETRLSECAGRGERIALIGESGCGKSSLVSHILGPTAESVAPIVVPVRSLGDNALRAESVADAILLQFERQVREVGRSFDRKTAAIGDRRDLVQRESRNRGADIGPKWLRGRAAEQVELQIGSSQPILLEEKIESIYQVLQAIQTDSLMSVFVFDDTDRWIGPSQSETVVGFFGEAIRWLTDMPTAVVVATHANYLESEEVGQGLLQYLDTPIEVPRVPSRENLARILERRVELNFDDGVEGRTLEDVVSESAVSELYGIYEVGESLRKAIQIAHIALHEAVDAGDETIEGHHIQAALQA